MKWSSLLQESNDRIKVRALQLQAMLLDKHDLDIELSEKDGDIVLTIPHEHANHEGSVTLEPNGWYVFNSYELGPFGTQDIDSAFIAVSDWLDRKWDS